MCFLSVKLSQGEEKRREEEEARQKSSLDQVIISKVIKPGLDHGLDMLIIVDIDLYILISF